MITGTLSFHFFFILLIPAIAALNSDGTFLLSFKRSLLSHPPSPSLLHNWNHADPTPCSWTGVTCAPQNGSGTPRVTSLALPNSQLIGSIPHDLGMLQRLHSLDLSNNSLNGTLPDSIFNCSELQTVYLSANFISGELPELINGLKGLRFLNLSDNMFSGRLPESLASLENLTGLSLKNNYFSGGFPGGFDSVEVLDLSSNLLSGILPTDFGGGRLRYLNLSHNKLSGTVFPEFAEKIPANAAVDLSFNNFSGQIPQTLSFSNQKTDYFAGNLNLCGKPLRRICTVPSTLSTPPNVSSNGSPAAAIAAIPKTAGETYNHGGRKFKPGKLAAIVVGDLAALVLLAVLLLFAYRIRKTRKEIVVPKPEESGGVSTPCSCLIGAAGDESSETETGSDSGRHHNHHNQITEPKNECLVMVDGETELELETLLKASAYILGSSGTSIVYKAVLAGGDGAGEVAFAVRRIAESWVKKMEFEKMVRVVAKMRHPNLVKVRGFYWSEEEKLVIYDYVVNGSLAGAAYKRVDPSSCHLPFETRLKIVKGVAKGLAYIHEKKQVHGNIKPSNILLTAELDPIISDFGLQWLMAGKNDPIKDKFARHKRSTSYRKAISHSTISTIYNAGHNTIGLLGCTSPYQAPEAKKRLKPNPKCDVYSFGVILLELLSGKVFSDKDLNQWTSVIDIENKILETTDVFITTDVNEKKNVILACLKLGIRCASLVPEKRPSMKDALQVLEKTLCPS